MKRPIVGCVRKRKVVLLTPKQLDELNPFPNVAGYIRHGHMRIFKKIQKILF